MKDERVNLRTDAVYERDGSVREFSATVISCTEDENGTYRIGLDLTAFSPEGGGQSWDKGTLDGLEVKGVYRENGEIVHVIDEPKEIGSTVVGEIDWEVRFRRMQEHSGEHLFCGILHNIHGYDNVGFHLSETGVTLDVDGPLSAEEIANIEKLANRAICEDIPIVASFPSPEEIKDIDYRSKLELDSVRLVTIEGIDICACCAPHVASTGQIGVIKVIDFMPHRGGTRIMLKSGTDAYEDFVVLAESTKAVMGYLSAKRYECAEAVERAMNAQLKLKEENTELKKAVTALTAEMFSKKLEDAVEAGLRAVVFYPEGLDEIQVRTLINGAVEKFDGIVAVYTGNDEAGYRYVCGRRDEGGEISLRELAKSMNSELSGRGGGSEKMIQGSVSAGREAIDTFWKKISLR